MNDVETAVQRQHEYDLEIEAQIAAGVRRRRWLIGGICVVLALVVGAFAFRTVNKLLEPELVAEDHFRQASADEARGDFLAASKALKRVLAESTGDADARIRLSDAYLSIGDGVSAKKEFDEAITLGYKANNYALHRAQLMLWERAYTDVLLALVADANGDQKSVLQGQAYLGLGQFDKAGEAFAKALELTPGHSGASLGLVRLALSRGDVQEARTLVDDVSAFESEQLSRLLLSGVIALEEGDFSQATKDFTHLQDQTLGASPSALIGLAQVAFGSNDLEAAKKHLGAIPRYYSKSSIVRYLRAVLALRSGDTHDARTKLLDLLKRSPKYTDAIILLVRIAYAEQDFGQARARLRTVLENTSDRLEPPLLMAMVQMQLGEQDDALQILNESVAKFPESPDAHVLLSRVLLRKNQSAEAEAEMSRARELAAKLGLATANPSRLLAMDSAWLPEFCRVLIDDCPNCVALRACH